MTRQRKRPRNTGAPDMSPWGTKFSGSFPSTVITYPKTGGAPRTSTLTTSRDVSDKQRPTAGKARLHPDGWRAPTPFRSYVCKLYPGPAFDYIAKNSNGDEVRHIGGRGYNPSLPQMSVYFGTTGAGNFPLTSQNLVNRATTEALNKLADSEANVAESLATMSQTADMVTSALGQMLNVYKAVKAKWTNRAAKWEAARKLYYSYPMQSRKKIRFQKFMKQRGLPRYKPNSNPLSKSGSSAWLELHYGWMPLVSDISFGMKALRDGLPKVKVTAIRNVTEDQPLPAKTGTVAPYTLKLKGKATNGCLVRIDTSLTHPNLAKLNSLGLLNPFQLGWELLPFSFVLDWLLPIGNALSGLSTPFGLNLKGISTTRWTKSRIHYEWTQYREYKEGSKISADAATLATYRTVSFFWPTPRTYFKSPFNLTRAVTALSLLNQLRK